MSLDNVTRRQLLLGGAALASWSYSPFEASAAGSRKRRFLFVNLRGGMDGLSLLAPVGDPAYEAVRKGLIVPSSGSKAGVRLDDLFVLNPNLQFLAKLWRDGDALLFHAAATPYRERSHFDGQDVLESGQPKAGFNQTGWLNRLLSHIPKGERVTPPQGLALGVDIPLVLRGPNEVINWMPPGFSEARPALTEKLLDLYNHTDAELARTLTDGLQLRSMTGAEKEMGDAISGSMGGRFKGAKKKFRYMGVAAGKLLARPDGPSVAAMNLTGWDTHQAEGPVDGRMARLLQALDSAIEGLHGELADVWNDVVIIIATEFGRTVKMNGSKGTDHGTATTAIAIGGALKGGRVLADWPGLAQNALYEGRDLMPTTDLRAVLKGFLHEHLSIEERVLSQTIFPESGKVKPLRGLIS